MSTPHLIETILEGTGITLIIFGFVFEDKLAIFEQKIISKIRRKSK